jgi:acetylornithine deacetylase
MSEVAGLLEQLISARTPNPGGDEPALCAWLGEALAARGADEVRTVEVARPGERGAYVLARWGTPRLLVNAHVDTVPPNAGWSGDPFRARVGDGRVVGLGAADTKGAIAAILCALDEARPRDLLVLFSGDEEHTGTCMRAFVAARPPELAQAIVCEPTNLGVGVRHRGILCMEARLVGRGGHSSRADELPRPLAELARLAVACDEWGLARRALGPAGFPGMCLNVAQLDGGVAFNVVPEEARLTVSVRPPPGADLSAVMAELRALAARAAPAAEVTFPVENAPFATRSLAGFARWLGPAVERPRDLGFWTEAAVLSEAGVDAVVFGPGDIAHAHAPDEWVAVEELEAARAAFVRVFRQSMVSHGSR